MNRNIELLKKYKNIFCIFFFRMLDPIHQQNENENKLHDWNIIPKNERVECDEVKPSQIGRKRLKHGPDPITWTVSDLAKAGCLLHSPPIGTAFEDEQEMRRVYTLIYDVFRCE